MLNKNYTMCEQNATRQMVAAEVAVTIEACIVSQPLARSCERKGDHRPLLVCPSTMQIVPYHSVASAKCKCFATHYSHLIACISAAAARSMWISGY